MSRKAGGRYLLEEVGGHGGVFGLQPLEKTVERASIRFLDMVVDQDLSILVGELWQAGAAPQSACHPCPCQTPCKHGASRARGQEGRESPCRRAMADHAQSKTTNSPGKGSPQQEAARQYSQTVESPSSSSCRRRMGSSSRANQRAVENPEEK